MPVNVEFVGEVREDYWYNAASVNPSSITVSGPASVVQQVSEAVAQVDVTDRTEPFNRSWTLNLVDGEGNVLSTNVLTRTSTSSTVRAGGVSYQDHPHFHGNFRCVQGLCGGWL